MPVRRLPTSLVPTRCVERHPTKKHLRFAGVAINLHRLSESIEPALSVAQLSRILSRKQRGSIDTIRVMAEALGMDLQAFLDELDRIDEVRATTPAIRAIAC